MKNCPHCDNELTIETTQFFTVEGCEHCFNHWIIEEVKCDHELSLVKFIQSNNAVKARKQCQKCYQFDGSDIGKFSKEERESFPEANIYLKEKLQSDKWNTHRELFNRRREGLQSLQDQKNTLWWKDYKQYLSTDKWRKKSQAVLQRDNYLCQACLLRTATQAHHKSYEFMGQEPLFDLIAICEPCHEHLHKIRNAKKN